MWLCRSKTCDSNSHDKVSKDITSLYKGNKTDLLNFMNLQYVRAQIPCTSSSSIKPLSTSMAIWSCICTLNVNLCRSKKSHAKCPKCLYVYLGDAKEGGKEWFGVFAVWCANMQHICRKVYFYASHSSNSMMPVPMYSSYIT